MRYFYNVIIVAMMNLLFLPFWWHVEDLIILPGIEAAVNIIVLPAILVALNVYWFVKKKIDSFLVLYLVIPLSCAFGGVCAYFNWGISTGLFFSPDEKTIMVVEYMTIISVSISLILLAMAHAMLKISELHITLGQKFLFWVGTIILTGVVAFIFGLIVYTVF